MLGKPRILCLEVGEHVPKPFAPTLLANLKRHATKGLVMSWSDDWEGIGHVPLGRHRGLMRFGAFCATLLFFGSLLARFQLRENWPGTT